MAKDQAAGVGQSAAQAGQHVAGVARSEAANVAQEATKQAKDIVGQARDELTEQAGQQQQRVAGGLRSLSTELHSMADKSDEPGIATDLARQAASRAGDIAQWLESRDPAGLIDEVKNYARRKPGTFLAIALGAGLAAGRLTRGLKDDSASGSDAPAATRGPSYPVAEPAAAPAAYEPAAYEPTAYEPTAYEPAATYTTGETRFADVGYVEPSATPPADPYDLPTAGDTVIVSPPSRDANGEEYRP